MILLETRCMAIGVAQGYTMRKWIKDDMKNHRVISNNGNIKYIETENFYQKRIHAEEATFFCISSPLTT